MGQALQAGVSITGCMVHIVTADLDADGDLEIVVPGKEGTQILWNLRI